MQSPMRLPGTKGMRRYFVEKNTFLDCDSPWALQPLKTLRKSASDPGSSREGSIFAMSKGNARCCTTVADTRDSSYGDALRPSDFTDASESAGSIIDPAHTDKDEDSWSAVEKSSLQSSDFTDAPESSVSTMASAVEKSSLQSSDFTHTDKDEDSWSTVEKSSLQSFDFTDAPESSGSTIDPAHSAKDDESASAVDEEQPSALESLSASFGSEPHRNGTCKPCKYLMRPDGCFLGDRCSYCHGPHLLGHPGTKWRPSKRKRQMCRDALLQMTVVLPTPDGSVGLSFVIGEMPASISKNPSIMQKLVKKFANHDTDPHFGVVYRL